MFGTKSVQIGPKTTVAPDAHFPNLDVGIDYYFSNLHLGTFSSFLTGLVKKIFKFFHFKHIKTLLQKSVQPSLHDGKNVRERNSVEEPNGYRSKIAPVLRGKGNVPFPIHLCIFLLDLEDRHS